MNLPLIFKSKELKCLVVGGGEIAARKVDILIRAECLVTVISPRLDNDLAVLVDANKIDWKKREYRRGDSKGFGIIIAATDVYEVNQIVSSEAKSMGIPINVVDEPELCTIYFPAIHCDNNLTIAVSTGGNAPFMAAKIRDRIASNTEGWGRLINVAGEFRQVLKREQVNKQEKNKLFNLFSKIEVDSLINAPSAEDSLGIWLDWLNFQDSD